MISTNAFLGIAVVLSVTGCGTTYTQLLPDEGLTSAQVYHSHQRTRTGFEGNNISGHRGNGNQPVDLRYYLKSPYQQDLRHYTPARTPGIEQLFPVVPNPQITGYVFPHLSSRGHPVPGYVTGFSLYEKTHYALPGEVPPLRFGGRRNR